MAQERTLTIGRGRVYTPNVRVVQMTAVLAEKILERNTLNRSLRAGVVEKYARDMVTDDWPLNAETIKVTDDGRLLDGQHRLYAIILANETRPGIAVPMMVVEGLDPAVMPTIDTGAARTFADVLTIEKETNTTMVASAIRLLAWWQTNPRPAGISGLKATHSELHAVLQKNLDFFARASDVTGMKKAKKALPPGMLVFVYAMAYRVDPAKAGMWLKLLDAGVGEELNEHHPIVQFRERMQDNRAAKAKLPPMEVLALAIKSWQMFLTGTRKSVLTWRTTEQFPVFAPTSAPRRRNGPR
jgi:hypothetical protein